MYPPFTQTISPRLELPDRKKSPAMNRAALDGGLRRKIRKCGFRTHFFLYLSSRYNGSSLTDNKPRYRKLIQYLLFAVAVLWIAFAWQGWSDQKAGVRAVKDRTRVADLTFPQLNGGSWRLSDHRGEVVLINYWASWCAPCRQETPGIDRPGARLPLQRAVDRRRIHGWIRRQARC